MLVAARSSGGDIVGCVAIEVSVCKGEVRYTHAHAQGDRRWRGRAYSPSCMAVVV